MQHAVQWRVCRLYLPRYMLEQGSPTVWAAVSGQASVRDKQLQCPSNDVSVNRMNCAGWVESHMLSRR